MLSRTPYATHFFYLSKNKKYGKILFQTISKVLTGIRNKRYFQITTANWPFQGIAVTQQNIKNSLSAKSSRRLV